MRLLILLFVAAISGPAFSAEGEDWVLLTISDYGGLHDYYGVVDSAVLDQIAKGAYDKPFITLEKPFFYDASMNIKKMSENSNNGMRYGVSGPLIVRVETIVRFADIDDQLTESRMEEHQLITPKSTPERR